MSGTRGRRPAGSTARQDIAAAAKRQFAESGYPGTTIRSIAREARVDARLVTHYYGSKQHLFMQVFDLPLMPERIIDTALAEASAGKVPFGFVFARELVRLLRTPEFAQAASGMLRAAATEPEAAALISVFIRERIIGPLLTRIGRDTDPMRGVLAGSQVAGLVLSMLVVQVEPLPDADEDRLVALLGPVFQHYLIGSDQASAPAGAPPEEGAGRTGSARALASPPTRSTTVVPMSSTSTGRVPSRRERPLPDGMTATDHPLPSIRIETPQCQGRVLRQGAQVLEWAPASTGPVLWVSSESRFATGAPVRGGVPVCFPWFSTGTDGHHQPSHGIARVSTWQLIESGMPDGIAHLLFQLTSDDIAGSEAPDALPGGATAYLSVGMADKLRIDLTVQAGTEELTFEEALHTYYSVGEVKQVSIEGLDGLGYVDKTAAGARRTQDGDVRFEGEVDRVYDHGGSARIVDPLLHRTITVVKRNSANTIVWTPGHEQVSTMADVQDTDWNAFVCVESGNVGDHAVTLQPGQSHTMTMVVDVALDATRAEA